MTISDVLELVNPGSLSFNGWLSVAGALIFAYGVPVVIAAIALTAAIDSKGPGGDPRKFFAATILGPIVVLLVLLSITPMARDMADTARSPERAVFHRELDMTPSEALSELYGVTITHDEWRATSREFQLTTPDTIQSDFLATIDGVERKLTIETVGDVYRIYYLDDDDVVRLTPPGGETTLPAEEPAEAPEPTPAPTDKGVFQQPSTTDVAPGS